MWYYFIITRIKLKLVPCKKYVKINKSYLKNLNPISDGSMIDYIYDESLKRNKIIEIKANFCDNISWYNWLTSFIDLNKPVCLVL